MRQGVVDLGERQRHLDGPVPARAMDEHPKMVRAQSHVGEVATAAGARQRFDGPVDGQLGRLAGGQTHGAGRTDQLDVSLRTTEAAAASVVEAQPLITVVTGEAAPAPVGRAPEPGRGAEARPALESGRPLLPIACSPGDGAGRDAGMYQQRMDESRERRVELPLELRARARVGRHRHRDDRDRHRDARRQAHAGFEAHADGPTGSRRAYPTPRTVWMSGRAPASSSLRRRYPT